MKTKTKEKINTNAIQIFTALKISNTKIKKKQKKGLIIKLLSKIVGNLGLSIDPHHCLFHKHILITA